MIAATAHDPAAAVQHLSDDLLKRAVASTASIVTGRNPYSKAWLKAANRYPELMAWVVRYGIAAIAECEHRFDSAPRAARKSGPVLKAAFQLGDAASIEHAPAPRGADTWQGLLAKTYARRGGDFTRRPRPPFWPGLRVVSGPKGARKPEPVVSVVKATVTRIALEYDREEWVTTDTGAEVDIAALQARYAHLSALAGDGWTGGAIRIDKLPGLTVVRGNYRRQYRGVSWVNQHRIRYQISTINRPTEGMLHEIVIHELAHLVRATHKRSRSGRRDVHGNAFQAVLFAAVREAFPGIDLSGVEKIRGCYPKDWEIARRIDVWLVSDRSRSAACVR